MKLPRLNWPLLVPALALSGMGLLALWMLSSESALSVAGPARTAFTKQAAFLAFALVAGGAVLGSGYSQSRRVAYIAYGVCLAVLVGLLLFGRVTRGARGWIHLGPASLQPAELMKIATVLAIARWLALVRDLRSAKTWAMPIALAGAPMALILAQPDLGNAILFLPVLAVMLFVGGAPRRWILGLAIAVAAAAPAAWAFGLKDYQKNRLVAFLWPDRLPREYTFQQVQSIRAVSAGSLVGRDADATGGRLPFYVPDRHTDFVFSVVGEELGFAGSTLVLALFAVFQTLAWRVAFRTRDPYGRLVVSGLATFFALQTIINVGMTLGVAPITGLTLPFVSYGGSSLLTCFLSLGLILNVDARWVPTFSRREMDPAHVEIREFMPQRNNWLVGALH